VGLCWDTSFAVYIPIAHKFDQPFEGKRAVDILKPLFLDNKFCAFNAAFELEFLKHAWGIVPNVMPIDTAILTRVNGAYDLASLAAIGEVECPEVRVKKYADFMTSINLSPNKNTIAEAPIDAVGDYCGRDSLATLLITQKLYPKLKGDAIYKLEESLFPVVMKMRDNGVLFDAESWIR
jgi:DNA polymerase I-like protein with 3'-5' exonuclease and polymerase domains